jgi:hypothetical protein
MKMRHMRIPLLTCYCLIAGLLTRTPVFAAFAISVNDIVLGIVGENEFEAGCAMLQNHPISWESDGDWSITVRSLDADLGMSDGGLYTKLLSDLQWKLSTESVWIPMTQTDTEVDWGYGIGSGVIYIDIKVLLEWVQDEPGNYQADLVFTIAPL